MHLWGWADAGEQVNATFDGASGQATADRLGKWSLFLAPHAAGGPFQLTVKGNNTLTFDDVLVGDVWFASGQSNMEMPMKGFPGSAVLANGAEEIRNANHPDIRLLLVHKRGTDFAVGDFPDTHWTACTPETAADFSAVAYFFGREIAKDQHVPVGLIDSTWGGTPAEAWVSYEGIAQDASLMPLFATWAEMADGQQDVGRMLAAEKHEDEAAAQAHQPAPHHNWHPDPTSYMPAGLYNGMVAPAINFRIKGVIWYQGETNSGVNRAPLYDRLFPALITDWRKHWGEGDFPFFFVQISNFKSTPFEGWPVVREAQRRTLALRDTGMAVTIDIGDPDNVHPPDKQDVGLRLALAARAIAYGEKLEYSGPMFRETSVDGNSIQAWFTHTDGGLVAKGGPLEGFEVAGPDHKFSKADARIEGTHIALSSASVAEPRYVRYGWANSPAVNLFNGAGLPASPFTSEPEMPRP